jgi:hypothetical protein
MTERPHYMTCIKRRTLKGAVVGDNLTWCGRQLQRGEFFFTGIDHAVYNGIREGRLLTCPDCAEKASEILGASTRGCMDTEPKRD